MSHFLFNNNYEQDKGKRIKSIRLKVWDTSWSILHVLFSDLKVIGKISELDSKV